MQLLVTFLVNVCAELIGSSYVKAISNGDTIIAPMASMLYYASFIVTTKVIVTSKRKSVIFVSILARGLGTWIVMNYCHGD